MDEERQELLAWWAIYVVCLLVIGLPVLGYAVYMLWPAEPYRPLLPFIIPQYYSSETLVIVIGAAVIATGIWALRWKWRKHRARLKKPVFSEEE